MKTLETKFTKHGFHHRQIVREGDLAIYERQKGKTEPHFEVIKIGHHDGYEIAGVAIPPSETYPGASAFGTHGWTYPDKDEAWGKFRSLLANTKC